MPPQPENTAEVMKHSCKVILETQGGNPMLFSFRATDGLESRNGEWYVQVESAVTATSDSPGSVGFALYEKNRKPDSKLAWSRLRQIDTTQEDFVALLKTGRCKAVDLLGVRQLQLV